MNRRDFLKALGATSLAPFVPAIAASPALDKLPFDDILSGKYPLFLELGNENGKIGAMGRQPITFEEGKSKEITFPQVTKGNFYIDRGFIGGDDGSVSVPFEINFGRSVYMSPGITLRLSDITILEN